jgi:hypothetical protein
MLSKICTRTAKSAPYPPCTVTVFWLKYQDPVRCLRRVTQPPHIAGPLKGMLGAFKKNIASAKDFNLNVNLKTRRKSFVPVWG